MGLEKDMRCMSGARWLFYEEGEEGCRMARPYITLSTKLIDCEADGSKCIGCGDMVFLQGVRFGIFHNGRRFGQSEGMLCQSCGEIAKERSKDE